MGMNMNRDISEKEFAVISEISNNHLPDQRTIAKKLGISLGLTNLIIKRLVKTGYVKIRQLNQRKIQYLLTPKGFAEKAEKSYNYTLKTINRLTLWRGRIQKLIIEKYDSGMRDFLIIGENELADLTEIIFNKLSLPDVKYSRELQYRKSAENGSVLVFNTSEGKMNGNTINLISYLSKEGT
ncbi:MAG: winged helix-turn-helix transcriptional regulator [Elusimicrobia bacterium]|nr:winged helix-turn-helix transcriptional regulator [Elusimicrobiota bacterium]